MYDAGYMHDVVSALHSLLHDLPVLLPNCSHHEDTVLAVDLGVMAFFILDFIMRFNIAYVSEHTGVLVTDRHKIAKKYFMSGWLVLDFVSTVPW